MGWENQDLFMQNEMNFFKKNRSKKMENCRQKLLKKIMK